MRKHKKLSIVLIIIFIILFCNLAYFFITKLQDFYGDKISSSSSLVAENVETYNNSKMGFEVQYPISWFIKDNGEDNIEIDPSQEEAIVYFSVVLRNDFKSLDEVKKELTADVAVNPIQINNASGFEYRDSASYEVIWLSHSNKIYTVRVYTSPSAGDETSQILSSFKFTN